MKDPKWPFTADHITNDKLDELGGEGIISNQELEDFLSAAATRLKHPVTVIEFPILENPPREIFDTNSKALGRSHHLPCEILCVLRDLTVQFEKDSIHPCEMSKRCHARCFRGLTENDPASQMGQKVEELLATAECLRAIEPPHVLLMDKTCYLEFTCPVLPYTCIGFPVFFEGKLVGSLFIGEIALQEKEEQMRSGFEKAEERYGEMATWARVEYEKDFEERALPKAGYDLLVANACHTVEQLADELRKAKNQQRKKCIEDKVQDYCTSLYHKIAKPHRDRQSMDEPLSELWKAVASEIAKMKGDFGFEYICVFGTDRFTSEPPAKLPAMVRDEDAPFDRNAELVFDLSGFGSEEFTRISTSIQDPSLLRRLPCKQMPVDTSCYVRFFPTPISIPSTTVTWAGYGQNWNPRTEGGYYRESGIALEMAIRRFYSIVASAHAAILAAIAEENLIKQIRIFGHEMAQLTGALDWISYELSEPDEFRKMRDEEIMDIGQDITAYEQRIQFLGDTAKYFVSELEPRKTTFLPFDELLFKWPDIYRHETQDKYLRLRIRKTNLPPPLCADPKLLEHLIYNLVKNAIKYCYPGTNISLDCDIETRKGVSYHNFRVTDYGIEFNVDNPFCFGARGSNTSQYEGLGIGLFIADKIARAHGGWVEYTTPMISKFSVPLIEAALKPEFRKTDELYRELKRELERLKTLGEFNAVVARHASGKPILDIPALADIQGDLHQPTYKVTLSVFIPN